MVLYCSALVLAQDYPGGDTSQSGDYGTQGLGQASGLGSTNSNCSGPEPGPDCPQSSGGGGKGFSSRVPNTGTPMIFSDDTGVSYASKNGKTSSTVLLPPQPPTEFQKFVLQSVGQHLPIFGSNLFASATTDFAPVQGTPVPSDYVIGPGDQLLIRGWGQVDINVRALVDRTGNIYVPKVGEINVTGVKYSEIAPYLKGVISRTFRNFDLSVTMGQLRSIQIFIVGQARRPGTYTVNSLSTLVNALFYSGGSLATGSMRRIQLRRNGTQILEFDLYDLLIKGDKSKDVTLLPGDVIFVPPVGAQVAIVGSVNTPAIYELKGETTLADAVKLSGGFTALTNDNKATVERVVQGDRQTFRKAEDFPLNESGLNRLLANGDIVRIAPMLPRFEDTVTLRGNVAWPGRYPWHKGMRIRDLIPSKEALLTRDFWRQQNPVYSASGEVRLLPETMYPPANQQQTPQTADTNVAGAGNAQGVNQQTPEQAAVGNSVQPGVGATSTGNYPKSSGSLYTSGSEQALQEGTPVSVGATRFRNDIKAAAPEINWDYAVIQRISKTDLSTVLIPFNLGKAVLDNDESQNLELYPGDVVTVFSQEDIKVPVEKQVKFVRLEGEFVASGVYRVEPGETLKELVERIGGVTPNAYLFGSEFTRESTRERQQLELNRIAGDLELQLRNASASTSTAASPEDAAFLAPQLAGQRQAVDKLRQLRATGRIVLELPGPRATLQDLPNIPLEDGDRFVVPYRPASVEVLGSVYSPNAFIWKSGKRMSEYLRDAGGPNRSADKRHILILRADGAVVSNTSGNGFWGGGIQNYRLEPGDAIVVPRVLVKGTFQRNFRDWSQIFSQLALGAASIAVLAGL